MAHYHSTETANGLAAGIRISPPAHPLAPIGSCARQTRAYGGHPGEPNRGGTRSRLHEIPRSLPATGHPDVRPSRFPEGRVSPEPISRAPTLVDRWNNRPRGEPYCQSNHRQRGAHADCDLCPCRHEVHNVGPVRSNGGLVASYRAEMKSSDFKPEQSAALIGAHPPRT